ncbi:hypothetical protein ACFQDF_23600 [Ectobacillus funiculus]
MMEQDYYYNVLQEYSLEEIEEVYATTYEEKLPIPILHGGIKVL